VIATGAGASTPTVGDPVGDPGGDPGARVVGTPDTDAAFPDVALAAAAFGDTPAAAIESDTTTGRGSVARGKITGVRSTTAPVNTSARKKRLSITGRARESVGDGVEAPRPEGMTTCDPLDREPPTTPGPMSLERLDGVVRTGGVIAAGVW